jgi:hypothetical protein
MMKALYFQFTVGVLPLYLVTFAGYWAYGSSTQTFLLNNVKGPIWVKAVANITAFLQSVIALHVMTSKLILCCFQNIWFKYNFCHLSCFTILVHPSFNSTNFVPQFSKCPIFSTIYSFGVYLFMFWQVKYLCDS